MMRPHDTLAVDPAIPVGFTSLVLAAELRVSDVCHVAGSYSLMSAAARAVSMSCSRSVL